jgi:hypothetical protein
MRHVRRGRLTKPLIFWQNMLYVLLLIKFGCGGVPFSYSEYYNFLVSFYLLMKMADTKKTSVEENIGLCSVKCQGLGLSLE